jgi:hypothetical protein
MLIPLSLKFAGPFPSFSAAENPNLEKRVFHSWIFNELKIPKTDPVQNPGKV